MALRLRRGTDAERQTITPKSGELLYVTDTGLVYVGDGTTQGGSIIGSGAGGNLQSDPNPTLSANLNLNGNAVIGSGDIDIEGSISATGSIVLGTVSSGLIPTTDSAFDLGSTAFRWQNGHFTSLFVDGEISANTISLNNIIGPDSSSIYDSETQTFDGNLKGSLIADDSSIIIDGDTGSANLTNVIAEDITSQNVTLSNLSPNSDRIRMLSELSETSLEFNIRSNNHRSILRLSKDSSDESSEVYGSFGAVFFERNDSGGSLTSALISGGIRSSGNSFILLGVDKEGGLTNSAKYLALIETENGANFGVGTKNPQETLDVRGSGSFKEYVIFGTYTTAERNEISAQNGMVIYNSTDNRFQGFQNDSWINLDDGSSA